MGQKLQDGKKVLCLSLNSPLDPNGWSKQLALLDSWQSLSRQYAQDFSPSWNARKCVQEGLKFQEIPGNLYFQKTSEKRLKSGNLKKNILKTH